MWTRPAVPSAPPAPRKARYAYPHPLPPPAGASSYWERLGGAGRAGLLLPALAVGPAAPSEAPDTQPGRARGTAVGGGCPQGTLCSESGEQGLGRAHLLPPRGRPRPASVRAPASPGCPGDSLGVGRSGDGRPFPFWSEARLVGQLPGHEVALLPGAWAAPRPSHQAPPPARPSPWGGGFAPLEPERPLPNPTGGRGVRGPPLASLLPGVRPQDAQVGAPRTPTPRGQGGPQPPHLCPPRTRQPLGVRLGLSHALKGLFKSTDPALGAALGQGVRGLTTRASCARRGAAWGPGLGAHPQLRPGGVGGPSAAGSRAAKRTRPPAQGRPATATTHATPACAPRDREGPQGRAWRGAEPGGPFRGPERA